MNHWQDITALAVVAVAAVYVARQGWLVLARQKRPGCGTCAKCPTAESPASSEEPPGLISLESLRDSASRK